MTKKTIIKNVNSNSKSKGVAQTALFAGLIILMAFTPFLGYIPLGFTRATIIHVPVILASLILGPKKGAFLGGIFGLTSFINNTINPTVTSFVFTPFYNLAGFEGGVGSLIICFVPRILTGVVPWYVHKMVMKVSKKHKSNNLPALVLSGVSGALTNTLLVMNLIFLFFRDQYAVANNVAAEGVYSFIVSIIAMNGVPEAIVAGILTASLGKVLMNRKVRADLGI